MLFISHTKRFKRFLKGRFVRRGFYPTENSRVFVLPKIAEAFVQWRFCPGVFLSGGVFVQGVAFLSRGICPVLIFSYGVHNHGFSCYLFSPRGFSLSSTIVFLPLSPQSSLIHSSPVVSSWLLSPLSYTRVPFRLLLSRLVSPCLFPYPLVSSFPHVSSSVSLPLLSCRTLSSCQLISHPIVYLWLFVILFVSS